MVGKFLLGMVSGGLVVAGGLIVASAVAPMRPANDTPPVPGAEAQVAPAAEPADAAVAVAEAQAEPAPAAPAESVAADPSAVQPDVQPEIAGAVDGPTAPEAEAAALAEPAAPAPAEVAAPETSTVPAKPAETVADVAAAAPDPAAPAAKEDTVLADAGPAAAVPVASPVPKPPADPAPQPEEPAAEPTPPPDPDPQAAATAETVQPDAVETAPAAPASPQAKPGPVPDIAAADPGPVAAIDPEPGVAADVAPPGAKIMPAPVGLGGGTDTMPGTPPEAMPGRPEAPIIDAPLGKAPLGKALADGTRVAETPAPTFKPTPGLLDSGEGLIIGRGANDAPAGVAGDPNADPSADPNANPEDPRPIARFAARFENPGAKPPLAVVLIDRGQPELDRAGLAALPFPVSFALDPLDPATPDRAALYRAAGREVVMLVTGIATGAQASDVEVAFQAMEQGLPEAVAAMDLADPAFQNNRGLASAVVPILKAQGRGLLTWDKGLNAADQVARRENLEAAVVFRDLGPAGTDRVAIRRLLDRAVFKAGQDGRVAVVGEADPETVAALLEWSGEDRAGTVALAPLTAVLRVD